MGVSKIIKTNIDLFSIKKEKIFLWVLTVNNLLQKMKVLGVYCQGNANDVTIRISGKFLNSVVSG